MQVDDILFSLKYYDDDCTYLPMDDNDKNFKPLTDPEDIKYWEEWISYTCKYIGVSVEEFKSKNFKTMKELVTWCIEDKNLKNAKNLLSSQIDRFSDKWIEYYKEKYLDTKKRYTDYEIGYAIRRFLFAELFKYGFIWGMDVRLVMEAEVWDDVGIFDTNTTEGIFDILTNGDIDYTD